MTAKAKSALFTISADIADRGERAEQQVPVVARDVGGDRADHPCLDARDYENDQLRLLLLCQSAAARLVCQARAAFSFKLHSKRMYSYAKHH